MPTEIDDDSLAELEELLHEDPELGLRVIAAMPPPLRDSPALLYLRAQGHVARGDWQEVVETLCRAVELADDDADAHHLLGTAYFELDDHDRGRAHYLRTWELDAANDDAANDDAASDDADLDEPLADRIADEARRILDSLPQEYRERLGNVLVVLEPRPSRALVEEGFDPRAYGLFEGLDHAAHLNHALSTQITRIVLFSTNLHADFPDPEDLMEEVRVTVLHEVGHYFGLDEDDMVRLGLE